MTRLAPSTDPFFLSLAFVAPHSGGPRDPDDPVGMATPSPAARHRDAFAGEPLPRSPAFDEADVSDKPNFIRRRPRLTPARVAAIEENYRQELESLLAVDEGVVRVVAALRASGELDSTLIVFTSDNGYFHGEHRVSRGKVMVYEPSIRVPLILRGPGVPAGARRRQLVSNADLAPTILDAAGALPGRVQDGQSLFGLLRDGGLESGRELLVEGPRGIQAVAFSALRNYRFTYAEHDNGARELYDLERDPDQLESVHDDPAYDAIQARLSRAAGRAADLRGGVVPHAAEGEPQPASLLGGGGRPRHREGRVPQHGPRSRPLAPVRGGRGRSERTCPRAHARRARDHARPAPAPRMSGRAARTRSLICAGQSRSLSSRRCTPSSAASDAHSGSTSPRR